MKRILLMVLKLFYIVPYYFFKIGKYAKAKNENIEEAFFYIKEVTRNANKAGKVTIEASGMERLPKESGFMLYPNHQGLFDMLVFLESCPIPFSFVIKKEASNMILLKQVIAALNAKVIDREDLKQSFKVILEVAEEVKKGRNFLIFPEGTRSKQGNRLLSFKGGSFKVAEKAKCPIVPCALIDSFKPFDENTIKAVTVKLVYLEPIYYEEYKSLKTNEIAALVKSRIEEEIESHKKN